MDVIVDELQRNSVNIDKRTLSLRIKEILERHQALYDEIAARLNPKDLSNVFLEMDVNNFGRAMTYLTLIYLIMDIPEDARREAVRLVAMVLKDMNITRPEEGFFQRLFLRIRRLFASRLEDGRNG